MTQFLLLRFPGTTPVGRLAAKVKAGQMIKVNYLSESKAGAEAVKQVGVDQELINVSPNAGDSLYSFLALSMRLNSYSRHKNKAALQEIMTDNAPHWQQPSTRRQP